MVTVKYLVDGAKVNLYSISRINKPTAFVVEATYLTEAIRIAAEYAKAGYTDWTLHSEDFAFVTFVKNSKTSKIVIAKV